MLDFVTFKKGHLDFFEPTETYKDFPGIYAEPLDALGLDAQAGTHLIDGKIVYISGFFEKIPGNWEVLIIPSIHLPKYAKSVVKDIRLWLNVIKEKTGARRLQTFGEPNEKQDKWLKLLGFTCDGTLPNYDLDGDKRIWSITWQDS